MDTKAQWCFYDWVIADSSYNLASWSQMLVAAIVCPGDGSLVLTNASTIHLMFSPSCLLWGAKHFVVLSCYVVTAFASGPYEVIRQRLTSCSVKIKTSIQLQFLDNNMFDIKQFHQKKDLCLNVYNCNFIFSGCRWCWSTNLHYSTILQKTSSKQCCFMVGGFCLRQRVRIIQQTSFIWNPGSIKTQYASWWRLGEAEECWLFKAFNFTSSEYLRVFWSVFFFLFDHKSMKMANLPSKTVLPSPQWAQDKSIITPGNQHECLCQ